MPDLSKSKFKTEAVLVSSTTAGASANVIYTVPNNFSAIVRFLHLSNNNTATKKQYVQFYHNDNSTYHHIVNGLSMAGNSVYDVCQGAYFNLHQGDKIVCYSETANTLDVTISVEEYYDPVRG